MEKRRSITAKDIAEACHVSQATISYVINNTPGKRISEAKRQEILETARRMKYFPNASSSTVPPSASCLETTTAMPALERR